MSEQHTALVPQEQQVAPRRRGLLRRHPVLTTIAVFWVLIAWGTADQYTAQDHGGVGEWFQLFGATFGVPLFFIFLIGLPLGGYLWLCHKFSRRFPGATALILSFWAGKAAARGRAGEAALYGVGAYQSAKTAAQQRGEGWVGGVPKPGEKWSPSPELIAGGLGIISGVGNDLAS